MRALCVNPWICDFKAFDFWMKPIGLLYVAAMMREAGYEVDFVDCLDRNHPVFVKSGAQSPKVDEFGRGKFYHEEIEKPEPLKSEKRTFKRYGMPVPVFEEIIDGIHRPDVILVTSMMTYWYPGVFEAIKILTRRFPGSPIVLGGVYPTLCEEHAKSRSGADHVVTGPAEKIIFKILSGLGLVHGPCHRAFSDLPFPAFDLYSRLDYACVITSRGCPFRCSYCGVSNLFPGFATREPESIIREVELCRDRLGVTNIAFYDDALVANPHFEAAVDEILLRKIRMNFHSPNGLHARFITETLARTMRAANFTTIYVSLETVDEERQKATGGKVATREFVRAVGYLKKAGFPDEAIHAYLMIGLPGQMFEEMIHSIDFVLGLGITPHLAEFSPIPGTDAFRASGLAHDADPLLHNNCLFPAFKDRSVVEEVKRYLVEKRSDHPAQSNTENREFTED